MTLYSRLKATALLGAATALCAACQPEARSQTANAGDTPQKADAQTTEKTGKVSLTGPNSAFLVKLTSSMSAENSDPGAPVTAVVIAPEPLRGGRIEGEIQRADRSFLNFDFHTLRHEGDTYEIEAIVTSLVNSKGVAGQDDLGQRIRFVDGGLIAYGVTTAVDEGAELWFTAWERE